MVSLDSCPFAELTSGQGNLHLFPLRELEMTLYVPDSGFVLFCFKLHKLYIFIVETLENSNKQKQTT